MISAAFALLAAVPAATFAPATETRYRLTSATERIDGEKRRRFTLMHDIVFHRDGDGFAADVVVLPPDQVADGPEAMFAHAYAALAGETVRYRLDRAGKIVAIDDLDRVWDRYVAAIAGMAGQDNPRAKVFADALRAQTPAQRLVALATPIETIVAPALAPGEQQVSFPARAANGTSVTMTGVRRTARAVDGVFHVDTDARSEPDATATIATETRLVVDAATMLVTSRSQRTSTTLGARTLTAITTATFAPVK